MKLHFLMVGFSAKKLLIQTALQAGAKISLLISSNKYKSEYENLFHQVLVVDDIYNWQQIKEAIDHSEKIDAVLTRHENYINVVGAINQYLGLDGINYEVARSFCNKYLMKQKWLEAQVPCANGICLDNLENLNQFLEKYSFPLILKKTSAAHSNFVVKVVSKDDLLQKLNFFKNQADGYITSKPVEGYNAEIKECHFLLEEMLHGRELTVDTFVSKGKFFHTPICEYIMAADLEIDDSYLPVRTMPTSLSSDQEKIVYETVEKALSALSAKNCVCHTELFFDEKNNNCMIIESTPRGGGYRTEMTLSATGYDYSLAVFKASANLELEPIPKPNKAVSVVEYFAEEKGVIEKLDLDFLNENQMVSNVKIRYGAGDSVEQAKFGGKTIVNFFIEAENHSKCQELAVQLINQIRKSVKINCS